MATPIRVLVVLDAGADRDAVEAVLPAAAGVELLSVVDDLNAGWSQVGGNDVDAVLVACGSSPAQALGFTEGVATEFPDRAVLNGISNGQPIDADVDISARVRSR